MKYLFLLFLSAIFCNDAISQTLLKTRKLSRHATYLVGDNFEGAILKKRHDSDKETSKTITPILSQVIRSEAILKRQFGINDLDTTHDNSNAGQLIIKELPDYVRQYRGYVNKNGDTIISVNMIHKRKLTTNKMARLSELISVFDGGSNYWNIEVDLTKQKLFGFWVNGR